MTDDDALRLVLDEQSDQPTTDPRLADRVEVTRQT